MIGAASSSRVEHSTARVISVSGVVFDSLAESPLIDADVQLLGEGSPSRAYNVRTDSAGRFVVPSVEAGSYLAGFFHPRLDSLGIDVPPVRLTLDTDSQAEVELAIPSRRTIIAAVCPAGAERDDATLLIGAVRDAATGERVPLATVSVQWSALAFQDSGLASVRQGGVVPTTPEGRFAICSVPIDAEFTVRAAFGTDTSGAVAARFPVHGILARDVYVAPLASDEPNASARLSGRVTSVSGVPVAGARLSLWGFEGAVRSNESGEYVFSKVPGGSSTLDVRAVGFEPVRLGIDLRVGTLRENSVSLVLFRAPTSLTPVTVVDTRISSVLLRSGFEKRRTGGVGRFVDADALEKMRVASTTSALAQFPGMLTRTGGRGTRIFMRDPSGLVCSPMVWVDGSPYSPAAEIDIDAAVDIDALADPTRIAGMEIYRRVSQAPLQYAGTTPSSCGVIVIWRKEQ